MIPEDTLADFNEAQDQFVSINHQPTEVRLEELLHPSLVAIPDNSESGKHNLSGIILDHETYKKQCLVQSAHP